MDSPKGDYPPPNTPLSAAAVNPQEDVHQAARVTAETLSDALRNGEDAQDAVPDDDERYGDETEGY
jgi:hypothetical protein